MNRDFLLKEINRFILTDDYNSLEKAHQIIHRIKRECYNDIGSGTRTSTQKNVLHQLPAKAAK